MSSPRLTASLIVKALAVVAFLVILGIASAWALRMARRPDVVAESQAAYARGDWQGAVTLARDVLKQEPANLEAVRVLARGLARLGRDEASVGLYKNRLDPATAQAEDDYLQGLSAGRLGNPMLALKLWEQGALKPAPPELLRDLARLATETQHLDEAVSAAQRLAKIPGWEANGAIQLGAARALLDDPAGASEALQRGLTRDPEAKGLPKPPTEYSRTLARSLLQLNRPAEARDVLTPLLAKNAADTEAAWLASRVDIQQGKPISATGLEMANAYRFEHPLTPEPSPFVGSMKCDSCHAAISASYRDSRHARTFHRGAALLTLPLPDKPLADPDDPKVLHTITREGGKVYEQTVVGDQSFRQWVAFAVGTPERYVSMVGRDGAGAYRALRLSHYHDDAGGSGWDRTSGDNGDPDPAANVRGQAVPTREGVARCVYCHVNNPRDFRDLELTLDKQTAAAMDRGIGCERCHGPGSNHLTAVAADLSDHAIANAGSAPASELATTVNRQCADCHTVADRAAILSDRENPRWVRSTGLTFTFSRCYTESAGALSCLTCHDPHRDSPKSATFYENTCLKCHSPETPARAEAGKAATVCKVNATRDCLNCHMPKLPMPALHTGLTDHYIRVRKGTTTPSR